MSRFGGRRAAALLIPAGLLALGMASGAAVYLELSPAHGAIAATARPPTVEARRSPLAATVAASGSIAPSGQSRLAFRSAGRVKDVLVAPGATVAQGQPLATLETDE